MSIQLEATRELGEILINAVFDYMQRNQDRFLDSNLSFEEQVQIVSTSFIGAKLSIENTMKKGTVQ